MDILINKKILNIIGPDLEIFNAEIATSQYDSNFTYRVGDIVEPELPFSKDWFNECESGIHFFITRIEAENY